MSSVGQDLRYALRALLHAPSFTAVAVLTLGLGIGANTAIFQLIDAVALRKLPVQDPDSLAAVRISGGNRGFGINNGRYPELTRPIWEDLQNQQQAFSGMFAWKSRDLRVGERSDLKPAYGIAVSGDFFDVLGVRPFRGRLLDRSDAARACPETTAVVSHAYWQREMGGRELGEGTRIRINFEPVDVVGVTPPSFYGLAVGEQFDIALPLCRPAQLFREVFDLAVVGRLRPDWTLDRASAHLDGLSAGLFAANAPADYSANTIQRFKSFRLATYPIASGVSALRSSYEQSLQVLLVITALILLTACANLANLMLARASGRDREVAVRVALGASRAALIRQFLAESVLLAAAGAALAVVMANVFSAMVLWAMSTQGSRPELSVPLDWRVLAFAAAAGLVTSVFFGVAPALRATRVDAVATMKSSGRGATAGHERLTFQRVMVASQVAMSLVMLVAALVFVGSFRNLITFDPGMRQEGIAAAYIRLEELRIAPERYKDFQRELLAEVKSVPGILNAGVTTHMPLIGGSWSHGIRVGEISNSAQFTWVSPGYFETMDISVLQGRDFTLQDTSTSARVAIVNQEFVRRFVGGRTPLGEVLRTGAEPQFPATSYQIVGVIPDTQYNDLRGEVRPIVFAPDSQFPCGASGHADGDSCRGLAKRGDREHQAAIASAVSGYHRGIPGTAVASSRPARSRAAARHARGIFWRPGYHADGRRPLRHALLLGRAAPRRNRRAHCAWRALGASGGDDDERGREAAAHRQRGRRAHLRICRTHGSFTVVRRHGERSADPRRGVCVARGDFRGCQFSTGLEGVAD